MPPVRPMRSTARTLLPAARPGRWVGCTRGGRRRAVRERPGATARRPPGRSTGGRGRRRWPRSDAWPADSPGSCNAWLLFVTTKPPSWRDPLHPWVERPLTLGEPHEGFLYPDPDRVLGRGPPLGRRAVPAPRSRRGAPAESLALTTLVHVGERPGAPRTRAQRPVRAAHRSCSSTSRPGSPPPSTWPPRPFAVPDPHRAGQVYEGWWGTTADGRGRGQVAAAPDDAPAVPRRGPHRVAARRPSTRGEH